MGTDIHFYVEKKEDNIWKSADFWQFARGRVWEVPRDKRFYSDRNYRLFSVLADVRNYHDSPYEILPILEKNRGIPEDLSVIPDPNMRDLMFKEECHNHNWLTLKEILGYPWKELTLTFERVYVKKDIGAGISSEKTLQALKKGEVNPDTWVTARDYDKINPDEYELTTVVKSLWDLCSDFTEITIPKMQIFGNPEEVRAVFAFDS